MVDEEVAGADRGELLAGRLDRVPRRPAHRHPRVVLEVRPVELVELAEIGEVEHPVERVDELVGTRSPCWSCSRIAGDIDSDTSSRVTSPKRARRSSKLDGLEQVVGLVGHLEVGVARDAEEGPLEDVHPREERGR